MKFLVDAHLPARLARLLNEQGHDATHTSELPNGNRTPDDEIAATADAEDGVVISKDRDFRNSNFLKGSPRRLLVVHTGNISNDLLARSRPTWTRSPTRSMKPHWRSSDPGPLSVHPGKSP
jgi:predicted nuclease of predicted toxin-antitoxin system